MYIDTRGAISARRIASYQHAAAAIMRDMARGAYEQRVVSQRSIT